MMMSKTITTAVKSENYSKATSLSRLQVDGAVPPVTQTAFPRLTATLRRCIKNENKRGSAAELAMRRPVPGENSTPTLRQLQESPLQWV